MERNSCHNGSPMPIWRPFSDEAPVESKPFEKKFDKSSTNTDVEVIPCAIAPVTNLWNAKKAQPVQPSPSSTTISSAKPSSWSSRSSWSSLKSSSPSLHSSSAKPTVPATKLKVTSSSATTSTTTTVISPFPVQPSVPVGIAVARRRQTSQTIVKKVNDPKANEPQLLAQKEAQSIATVDKIGDDSNKTITIGDSQRPQIQSSIIQPQQNYHHIAPVAAAAAAAAATPLRAHVNPGHHHHTHPHHHQVTTTVTLASPEYGLAQDGMIGQFYLLPTNATYFHGPVTTVITNPTLSSQPLTQPLAQIFNPPNPIPQTATLLTIGNPNPGTMVEQVIHPCLTHNQTNDHEPFINASLITDAKNKVTSGCQVDMDAEMEHNSSPLDQQSATTSHSKSESSECEVESDPEQTKVASPNDTQNGSSLSTSSSMQSPVDPTFLSDTEVIPTIPVESEEVINFINNRGLDRLVDSIENFAEESPQSNQVSKTAEANAPGSQSQSGPQQPVAYIDGLRLLSALAEQRAIEEEEKLESQRRHSTDCHPSSDLVSPKEEAFMSTSSSSPSSPIGYASRASPKCPRHEESSKSSSPVFEAVKQASISDSTNESLPMTELMSSSTDSILPPSEVTPKEEEKASPTVPISTTPTMTSQTSATIEPENMTSEEDTKKPRMRKKKKETPPQDWSFGLDMIRRSERLFVLESYSLSGIRPPDARRELFEKAPPKARRRSESSQESREELHEESKEKCKEQEPMEESKKETKRERNGCKEKLSAHKSKRSSDQRNTESSNDSKYFEGKRKDLDQAKLDKESKFSSKSGNAGGKGNSKKLFFEEITRGDEVIKVGDCAVFHSPDQSNLPYVGRIDSMWQSSNRILTVRLKWFYHPEETKSPPKLKDAKMALFESCHYDQNDARTISHKCSVLPWNQYQAHLNDKSSRLQQDSTSKVFYLAGFYDPLNGQIQLASDVPLKDD